MRDSQKTIPSHGEITVVEIWRVIAQNKLIVIASPIIAVAIALIFVSLINPQWESVALIRIGQVGTPKQLIEPTVRAIQRIKLEGFKTDALEKMDIGKHLAAQETQLFFGSLKAEAGGAPDLVKISTRGYSPDQARQFTLVVFAELAEQHNALSAPSTRRLIAQAEQLKKDIAFEMTQQELSKRVLSQNSHNQNSFMEKIVLTNNIFARAGAIRTLRDQLAKAEDQLDPLNTYPTALMQSIFVAKEPVTPSQLIIPLAAVLGIFIGLFAAFLRNSLRIPSNSPSAEGASNGIGEPC